MMEVKIVSRESIKPSSPTPHHLRIFKLSLLDQLIPAPYAPLVFYYPSDHQEGAITATTNLENRLHVLKTSLSQTLTLFYPLAGKIVDDLSIDCNDEGAYYAEAKVNCRLDEFLNQPDLQWITRLLPCGTSFTGSAAGTTPVTNIQVNMFECGGIAIGLCISHKILDGAALSSFVKGWCATARGSKEVVSPNFSATSMFPTSDLWLRDLSIGMWGSLFKMGKCTTRRFALSASAIDTLKAKAAASDDVLNPTRVEAVSAFIWKCAMAASEEARGNRRHSLLTHVVNLRNRVAPPLSEHSVGNLIWIASAQCAGDYDHLGLRGLARQVREGISKINNDFVKKLRGEERSNVIYKSLKRIEEQGSKKGVDYFGFTSWCNFGFYDADFGWGKPVWVSTTGVASGDDSSVFMNLILLMEARGGNGIEAWVTLDEQEMAVLECDAELLTFASLDPSPLELGRN